jgi:Flp pilus assembly protein TadG
MQHVKTERGSVIVFVTLMIVLLMIMVGLGLDTGQLTYVRNQGQAAVDAAALAAVSALPSRNDGEVKSRAAMFNPTKANPASNNYVESATNTIGSRSSDISYVQYDFKTNTITKYDANIADAKTNGVRVALEQANGGGITTPVFLTPLLNLLGFATAGTQDVSVSAVSVITARPAIPIALWSNVCGAPGEEKTTEIKMQHPDQKDDTNSENSCWTTFLDCSSGARDIRDLFKVADECSGGGANLGGKIEIGTEICQNRGQVTSALNKAEDFFTKDHPNRWWLVPVIAGGGNCDPSNPTKVTNWAKSYPTGFSAHGNPKTITAKVACDPTYGTEFIEGNLCFNRRLVRELDKGY